MDTEDALFGRAMLLCLLLISKLVPVVTIKFQRTLFRVPFWYLAMHHVLREFIRRRYCMYIYCMYCTKGLISNVILLCRSNRIYLKDCLWEIVLFRCEKGYQFIYFQHTNFLQFRRNVMMALRYSIYWRTNQHQYLVIRGIISKS